MENIKIYVACHRESPVPKHPFLLPIQVGSVFTKERFRGMIADDTGKHISDRNRSYCELTAQYWAWKNDTADWQGMFHYRRYLDFSRAYTEKAHAKPYYLQSRPTEQLLLRVGYDPQQMQTLLDPYDVVVPLPEEMHITVKEQYCTAPHHHPCDLKLMLDILYQTNQDDFRIAEQYFNDTQLYVGNLFLMRSQYFHRYSEWLFQLLDQYDLQKNVSDYSQQALRVDGYLAERLLGVFVTRLKNEGASVAYVPRIHFAGFDEKSTYWMKKTESILLPPGSIRRGTVRRLIRHSNDRY